MKKILPLILASVLLCSCDSKQYFRRDEYASSNFDNNYYLKYDENEFVVHLSYAVIVESQTVTKLSGENLSKTNEKFKDGILSRLYDGETTCNGVTVYSRIQLDQSGFGTNLPSTIEKANYFEFCVRGGTTCEIPLNTELHFDFGINLVANNQFYQYIIRNASVCTDMSGKTTILHFNFPERLKNISYYEISFACTDLPEGIDDNYKNNEKEHLAIMLYEVLIK